MKWVKYYSLLTFLFVFQTVLGDSIKIAGMLPFLHGAEMEKAIFRGDFAGAAPHILPVLIYSAAITAVAVWCFLRQMKKQ